MKNHIREDLIASIDKDIEENRNKYESTKLTLVTAGLLVALSLNPQGFKSISLFGKSAYKLALLLIAFAAIASILTYIFNEFAMIKAKKFISNSKNTNEDWQRKRIPIKFLAVSIDILNSLDTIFCLLAFGLFAYMIIRM
jgi:hypothetical protein